MRDLFDEQSVQLSCSIAASVEVDCRALIDQI